MEPTVTASLDLLLELDTSSGRRTGLEETLRKAIQAGRLSPGATLPSTRALARELGWARNTVAEAYAQLAAEGYLRTRQGALTVVAGGLAASRKRAHEQQQPDVPVHDLRPGRPDPSSFPRRAWLSALRLASREAPDTALGYGPGEGDVVLREALAAYLGRTRGVLTSASELLVWSGFRAGLFALCVLLRRRGEGIVAVEDPCFDGFAHVIRPAGLEIVRVPVDEEGMDVERLAQTGARAVLLTPAHQYPLGVPLSPARRVQLVEWARGSGALIVEDDYDGEFRYDRQPVGALQALAGDCVVYGGTAAKMLAPALRIGWMAVPREWAAELAELKRGAGLFPPALGQRALAHAIASGVLDRHVRRMRARYRARREYTLAAIRAAMPDVSLTGIDAGLHVTVLLPPAVDEATVLEGARGRGIALQTLGALRGAPGPGGLIVGFAAPPEHDFERAVEALAELLGDVVA